MAQTPLNITKYIVYRCNFDGDAVTNLRMQKLLYFVYVWHLVKLGSPCFEEKFQAWPNGPVLASVYRELKQFGTQPIDSDFSELEKEEDLKKLEKEIGKKTKDLVDGVYEEYAMFTPFELVVLSHEEVAWKNARKGLDVSESSNKKLSDEDILSQHG